MIKLPADVKKRWLTALRSGKYKQGQSRLYNGEAHCCLGVLYEVMGGTWTKEGGDYYTARDNMCYLNSGDVPEEVMIVLEQQESIVQYKLSTKNDLSLDFDDNIKWIEAIL